jgi:hypothetical protein
MAKSGKIRKQSVAVKNFAQNLHFSLKQKEPVVIKKRHRKKSGGKCFVALAFAFGFCSGGLLSVLELRWLPHAFTSLKSKLVLKNNYTFDIG